MQFWGQDGPFFITPPPGFQPGQFYVRYCQDFLANTQHRSDKSAASRLSLLRSDLPLIAANSVTLLLAGTVLVLKLRHG